MQSKIIYFSLLMIFVISTITSSKKDVRNSKSYINFADIAKGGEIVFEMEKILFKAYGFEPSDRP